MCLIARIDLQLERRLSGLSRAARPALAGLLALLLLGSGTLSVSYALHQSLHNNAAGGSHFCLVCLFAKGQVSAAEVAFVAALLVLCPLSGIRAAKPSPWPGFDYRLSPSRAPPAILLSPAVVG